MKLENISVNFLGDSITEGWGATAKDKVFHYLLAKKYNFKETRNYGIGGTRFAKQLNPQAVGETADRSFSQRFSSMDDDAQLVVVFGGTNDFGHGDAPMGRPTDRMPNTFYGACHYLMNGLIEKYPTSKIVFITPLHRVGETNPFGDGSKKMEGCILSDYVNAIKETAEYYSIPVIDLWSVSGIQPNISIIKEKYCPDGLHLNDNGHEKISEIIGNYLELI